MNTNNIMNLFDESLIYQMNKNNILQTLLEFYSNFGTFIREININELNNVVENNSNIMPIEVFIIQNETYTELLQIPETFAPDVPYVPENIWHENFASEPFASEPLASELLWYENLKSDWQFILIGYFILFAIIYLEWTILHMNDKTNINEEGGRYRHICRGRSLNNKRCKRCVKNTLTCYQH